MNDGAKDTIAQWLTSVSGTYQQRPAIVDADVTLSYAELHEQVRVAARALMALGVASNDRVAIWAPNMWEWIVAALSIQLVGAAVVPINTRYKGREASYILDKSGAQVLFTVRGFLDTDYPALLDEADALEQLRAVILMRGEAQGHGQRWTDWLDTAESTSPAELEQRAAATQPDAISDLMFTSGTTGQPKAVMVTQQQTLSVFRQWSSIVGLEPGDRYLIVVPFFHSFGYKAGWLSALTCGATVLPHPVFDAGAVLHRIERDRVTVLPGPPALYQMMLAHPQLDEVDRSSLRLAVTGAAVVPVQLIEAMHSRLGFDTVITGYGLTETTGVVTMCRRGDDHETIANTSGRAIDGVQVRVVDADGAELDRGAPGEVVVRGPNVMLGYFGDPEQTAATIRDGWLHTGDIGVMDERGYLRITDRLKDMYIVGGFNAYPAEIENMLLGHDEVEQVAVVGVPDRRLGEVGFAFVVSAEDKIDQEQMTSWCRERMANYKVPRHFHMIDALPLNATGKVLKHKLRDMARELLSTD